MAVPDDKKPFYKKPVVWAIAGGIVLVIVISGIAIVMASRKPASGGRVGGGIKTIPLYEGIALRTEEIRGY